MAFTSPSTECLIFFVKADMSVTSLTSHNIVFPQERTIQVEETQNCFNKDEAKSFVFPVLARFFVQLRQLPIMC